jgi:oligosaccharide repeat unit polymerase
MWPVMRAFGSATRSSLIVAVLPIAAVIYFKSSVRTQRLMLITTVLCAPLIYYFMAAMVGSRNSGEFSWEAGANVTYVGNEMLQELAYIVENVPERCNYQWGYNYYVQIVNPIPRFIWPGKPTLDTGILLAQMKGSVDEKGEVTYTNSPGMIGEMYMNLGLAGIVVLSAFGGWLARGWDRVIELNYDSLCTMIFYSMGLAIFYVMGRSFNMVMFYAMFFLFMGVWIVINVMGYRSTQQPRRVVQAVQRPQQPSNLR